MKEEGLAAEQHHIGIVSPNLVRKVFVMQEVSAGTSPEELKATTIIDQFCTQIKQIQHALDSTREYIILKYHIPLPTIALELDKKSYELTKLNKLFVKLKQDSRVRIIHISSATTPSEIPSNFQPSQNASHQVLIGVQTGVNTPGIYDGPHTATNFYVLPHQDIIYVIFDTLLDIAFFNALHCFSSKFKSINTKHNFSQMKLEYAKLNQLEPFFGKIFATYGCLNFSDCVRTTKQLTLTSDEISQYIKLWSNFILHHVGVNFLTDLRTKSNVLDMIGSLPKISGFVSRELVERRIAELPAGRYLFVLVKHIPPNKLTKDRLSYFMNKPVLHQNNWRFVSESEATTMLPGLLDLQQFVIIRRFEIGDTNAQKSPNT